MTDPLPIATLTDVLDRVAEAARDRDEVRLEQILDAVGQRSFGPLLLLIGVIVLAPLIGDIPGVPTLMAVIVLLLSFQLLLHRQHFWLPPWLRRRSVRTRTLNRTLVRLKKPAQWIDRLVQPRLVFLIRGYLPVRGVAIACSLTALLMPLMEFIPFSANFAGMVLTLFGLALIGRDGLLALIGYAFTGGAVAFVLWALT